MVRGDSGSYAADDRVTLCEVRTLPVCRTARRALFREVVRRETRRCARCHWVLVQNAGLCRQSRRHENGHCRQQRQCEFLICQYHSRSLSVSLETWFLEE